MSSPDVTTGTRLEPPWSEDYHTTVEDMETNDLLKSTLTDESHKQKGDTKTCLFCGLSHYFRPVRSRDHLGVGNGSKKVQRCNPYPDHIECHPQVVKELKERHEHDKIQVREVVKRSL